MAKVPTIDPRLLGLPCESTQTTCGHPMRAHFTFTMNCRDPRCRCVKYENAEADRIIYGQED